MEPRGIGTLQKLFEQLKSKLAAEGLFDERYKKNIPILPGKIGIITSPTGAVIKDILNITQRRFPSINILIAPVRVQGAEAAAEIVQALRNFHVYGDVDVIIIARGGGSLEDIAPFNNESLAREIFKSSIPIVSAVGHETDFTICDFVADLRAPTPSAAAELVSPERLKLLTKLNNLKQRLFAAYCRYLADRQDQLAGLQERLKDPRRFLIDLQIRLDELKERLKMTFYHEKKGLYNNLRQIELRLFHQSPIKQISEKKMLLRNIQKDIHGHFFSRLAFLKEILVKNSAILESLSPLKVLQRGYSITRSLASGMIVRKADALNIGENINIQLAKGNIHARVQKISRE
jgi:exodeoxyribonuclease VII large subunit